jgi:hypothetical protein
MAEPSSKRVDDKEEEVVFKPNRAAAVKVLNKWKENYNVKQCCLLDDNPTASDIVNAVRVVFPALEEMHNKETSFDLLTGALQTCITTATHLLSIEFPVATLEELVASGPWSRDWSKKTIEAFVFPGKKRVPLEPHLTAAFLDASTGQVCLRQAPSSELRQLVNTYKMQETTNSEEGIFTLFSKSANEIPAFPGEAVDSTATPQIYFVFASS